jgi:antitoxin component of MazEF toxin-antitoxin module
MYNQVVDMSELECTTKKWGNSLGIVLPKELVERENIKINEKLVIDLKKVHRAKEFFGLLPNWKVNTQKLKNELRKGWD